MQIIHVTPTHPEYGLLTSPLRMEPLRTQWWNDAESEAEPDVSYVMIFAPVGGRFLPAAWAGYRIEQRAGGPVLKCCNNYVRRGFRGRSPDLYELVYRARHRGVVVPSGLPAETFLFPEPIPLHTADGWVRTGEFGTSWVTGREHHWRRLTRAAATQMGG